MTVTRHPEASSGFESEEFSEMPGERRNLPIAKWWTLFLVLLQWLMEVKPP